MPRVDIVEKRIFEIEGFQVDILKEGKNVRGDSQLPKQYSAERMTRNSMTVGDWKINLRHSIRGTMRLFIKAMEIEQQGKLN